MKIIEAIETYVKKYTAFENEGIAFPIALWTVATHLCSKFDAFPYLVITSLTKRSGKTRLSELISFVCERPMNSAAMSASAMFRSIDPQDYNVSQTNPPTIIFDEAEMFSSEAATTMRAVLNAGYRKGQTVARTVGLRVVNFKVYCPKIFILIGDVYDTLRDRSIVITMKRAEVEARFLYDAARDEGARIKDSIAADITNNSATVQAIESAYATQRAKYLSDRDEEIWAPLFAICKAVCPERERELQRIAVDLCALKSAEKRVAVSMNLFEAATEQEEYAKKALEDLHVVLNGDKAIFTDIAVSKMRELDLSPWRTFRGAGLDALKLADLLSAFGLRPCSVRIGKDVRKGYRRIDVNDAMKGVHGK
jgi:hypothetical protein